MGGWPRHSLLDLPDLVHLAYLPTHQPTSPSLPHCFSRTSPTWPTRPTRLLGSEDVRSHLIIIGAGLSGLSAAIAARKRSLDYVVLEQGTLVNSIFRFPPQMVALRRPSSSKSAGCHSCRRSKN